MTGINVIITPPAVYDVVVSPFDISKAVTANEVLQTIGQNIITGQFALSGSGNISVSAYNNNNIVISSFVNAPTGHSASGNLGQMALDTGFLYLCVAPNTWKRVGLNSW